MNISLLRVVNIHKPNKPLISQYCGACTYPYLPVFIYMQYPVNMEEMQLIMYLLGRSRWPNIKTFSFY